VRAVAKLAVVAVISLICVGYATLKTPTAPQQLKAENELAERESAQKLFLSMLTRAKKTATGYIVEDPYKMERTWGRGFKEGDRADKYAVILATGTKRVEDDGVLYEWVVHLPLDPKSPDSRFMYLMVLVKGDPPRIEYRRSTRSID
jgi:hypothetical protein